MKALVITESGYNSERSSDFKSVNAELKAAREEDDIQMRWSIKYGGGDPIEWAPRLGANTTSHERAPALSRESLRPKSIRKKDGGLGGASSFSCTRAL